MRGEVLLRDVAADGPIMIDMIDSPYAENEQLKALGSINVDGTAL
jgi:hypothetical protein